jgi:hypothetical protein
VQLLDPIPVERIPKLIARLGDDDLYLAYQYGLVFSIVRFPSDIKAALA